MKQKLMPLSALLAFGLSHAQQMPQPTVSVMIAQPETVHITRNMPARLAPSREAAIYPQVGGIVKARHFKEGSKVEAGQALYQIDDALYQANVQSALAQLAQAQANKTLAQSNLNRHSQLVKEQAVSKQVYDQSQAQLKVADANIEAAKAGVKLAEINVAYAKVKAPISGVIGRSLVSEGALVNSGVQMANIQQLDPMTVNIYQTASEAMAMNRRLREQSALEVPITLSFEDGQVYPHEGKLLFTEQTVEASTGEVLLRAEIPNPDGLLLPNLYVRVEVPQATYTNAFLIPQKAVTRGAVNTVNIVSDDGTVTPREVSIAQAYQNHWVVTDGLQAGERVALDSVSMLQMGMKVLIKE
ncbi:MAG: efflux RND transporter periplasmic adaptor subunit [Cardiobacteriaceae bacterium]|nr:efflux RND transporter periplasmic adaptor subunit [Cardiobacteriaceae bacterium]